MHATAFDSLAVARKLKAAGVEENQAEVFAESMREASVVNQDDFATKADLRATKADLKADLDRTKADLEAQIKASEARLRAEIVTTANRNLIATLVALGVMLAVLRLL